MANTVETGLFASHPRNWQDNHYVYPVLSRRSNGLSIGINLNPDKICNFDCIYCQVDRTVPAEITEVDLPRLRQELDQMLRLAYGGELFDAPHFSATPPLVRRINDIAFSGDGEPTTFRQFDEVVRITADIKRKLLLEHVKIVVISNATQFHRDHVQRALSILDDNNGEIWAKLDAGTDAYYHKIAVTSIPLQSILDNILLVARERPIVIQSLFMRVDGVGPDRDEIEAYVKRIADLIESGGKIKLVQVYTVARPPAQSNVTALDNDDVDDIVRLVRRELGLRALPYYGLSTPQKEKRERQATKDVKREADVATELNDERKVTTEEPAAATDQGTGMADTGTVDTGTVDTGIADTGTVDTERPASESQGDGSEETGDNNENPVEWGER